MDVKTIIGMKLECRCKCERLFREHADLTGMICGIKVHQTTVLVHMQCTYIICAAVNKFDRQESCRTWKIPKSVTHSDECVRDVNGKHQRSGVTY